MYLTEFDSAETVIKEYDKTLVEILRETASVRPFTPQTFGQARVSMKEAADAIETLQRELAVLRGAIEKTLRENGHLADGDNCTLIDLKQALAGQSAPLNPEFQPLDTEGRPLLRSDECTR